MNLPILYKLLAIYSYVTCVLTDDTIKVSRDLRMPLLGFGTAALGDRGVDSICLALNSGFRLFDSAQAKEWYQEQDMGTAIKNCWKDRTLDELVIITKVHPRSYQYEQMKLDLQNSQQFIYGTNRTLDVVLLHSPYCWWAECTEADKNNSWQMAWENLEKFQSDGVVDSLGVSNFNVPQLQELMSFANKRIGVVQNWMDPFHQDVEVRNFCKEHGIVYMAYSSLGTQWDWRFNDNPVFKSSVLQEIAAKHTMVVMSWVIQEGAVAIPRTTNPDHILENAGLFNINPRDHLKVFLNEEDMDRIRVLDGSLYNPEDN